MAGLVMFRRRWGIAADDFVFPGGFEMFLRVVWLFVVLFAYFLEDSGYQSNCGDSFSRLEGFLISSMILQGIIFLTDILIVAISSLGTLSDDRPRRHIVVFLYIRCFLFLPEAILAAYGAYYMAESDILTLPLCPVLIKSVCLFGVAFSIAVLSITIIIVWIIFDPLGASQKMRNKRRVDSHLNLDDDVQLKYRRRVESSNVWETRLRALCCCFVSDTDVNRSALKDVAQLFSEMFEVEMDVVTSDIASGLVLLQRRQENEHPSREISPRFDRLAKPMSWMTASNLSYFSKFALAIYGWPLFVFMNPCSGPFRLCKRWSRCGRQRNVVVRADDRCNLAGLEALLDSRHVRILHYSFTNQIFNSPFFVAVDDDARAIVISVRGTMSFMDAITDVMTHCDPIFGEEGGDEQGPQLLAHRGIIKSADNLLVFLRQSQLLESTLNEHPDYTVVTTGHSLGAGVAVVLALKLRRQFQFSSVATSPTEVRCFAFSPPGGLLSVDAQKVSRECVMSVVLDIDFIPRLSYHTFVKLRDALIREIERAEEPKFEILAKGFCSALARCAVDCCGRRRRRIRRGEDGEESPISPRSLNDEDQLLSTGVTSSYTEAEGVWNPDIRENVEGGDARDNGEIRFQPKLYPPGQILLLKNEEVGMTHGKWVGPEYFQEIIVGTTMMTDHLPDRVFVAVNDFSETQKSGLNRV